MKTCALNQLSGYVPNPGYTQFFLPYKQNVEVCQYEKFYCTDR